MGEREQRCWRSVPPLGWASVWQGVRLEGFSSVQAQRTWWAVLSERGRTDGIPLTAPVGAVLGGAPGQLQNKGGEG